MFSRGKNCWNDYSGLRFFLQVTRSRDCAVGVASRNSDKRIRFPVRVSHETFFRSPELPGFFFYKAPSFYTASL
ncbi:hypothetical protein CH367_15905 [Leptospira barantonii]|uniref:DUF1564 family protein n=1 Tax=Leptospira barantonii TaxID=2023184 RepID=A0ABX4NHQ3_9LEPT|nr:hypothetical protein CH367_15905 [Leptospira barantonii]